MLFRSELWERAGNKAPIANAPWPEYDEALTVDDQYDLVIQVNGKLRSKVAVNKDISKDEMLCIALDDDKIKHWVDGKTIIKKIAVPNKLVNIVVK